MEHVLAKLFLSSCKIGLLAFGGGNTAIPLLEADAVPVWVSEKEFAELVGVNFAFPGISILKISGMIGLRAAGVPGMLVSIAGLATPGLLLTVAAYSLLARHREHTMVQRALTAMQYAAVALLASSALNILQSVQAVRTRSLIGLALVAGLFAAVQFLKLSPAMAVLAAVGIGLLIL